MRKLFATIVTALMFGVVAYSQTIAFLGIPIDGSLKSFNTQLKNRGYEYSPPLDVYYGVFNGKDVLCKSMDNHGEVWRVYVRYDISQEERYIASEYNTLIKMFQDSAKYHESYTTAVTDASELYTDIKIHGKIYESSFLTPDEKGCVWFGLFYERGYYYIGLFYDNLNNSPNGEDL